MKIIEPSNEGVMTILRFHLPFPILTHMTAFLFLLTGCPTSVQEDDDSAVETPADAGQFDTPAVRASLAWPRGQALANPVPMEPATLCPAAPDRVSAARNAYLTGQSDVAAAELLAHLDGGGEDGDGSAHLLLGTILFEQEDHQGAVDALAFEALLTGPLAGDAAMMAGESLEILELPAEAAEAYLRVPHPSRLFDASRVRLAAIALDDGKPEDAITALLPLLSDPSQLGSRRRPEALVLLGRSYLARGEEGDDIRAYDAFVTAWATGPVDEAAGEALTEMEKLEATVPAEHHPTVRHRFDRAAAYHQRGHWNSCVKELEAIEDDLPEDDPLITCEAAYMRGRSLHKRKKYTEASAYLDKAATACAGVDDEMAVKAIYNRAQGLQKLDRDRQAADTFLRLPERFPTNSYADDGYLKAALIELDLGRPDAARTHLQKLVDELPPGDMYGEALWRLAWTEYRAGDQPSAVAHLRQIQQMPTGNHDRKSLLRARYWEAKMLGWPDGEGARVQRPEDDPGVPADLEAAAERFAALANEHPLSYYGAMGFRRLQELNPEQASAVAEAVALRRDEVADTPALPDQFQVDGEMWLRPQREIAQALACAGIRDASLAELRRARASADPWDWQTEQAIALLASAADDPFVSHNTMRVRFRTDHPEQLGPGSWSTFHLAYPDAFGAEVRGAVTGKPIPSRLMHGLVREESAFQTRVVSWAGANGLSQLMWGTAKLTAKKMGIKGLKRADLADPATNLAIGSKYLSMMHDQFGGNLVCAVAAYNAGPGSVERWLKARSGYPADEWVEDIPYKETRGYVPRVMDSYQTYSLIYEGDPVFVELPVFVPTRE